MIDDSKKYDLFVNERGRRILIVHGLFSIEDCKELTYDNFDAIFIARELPTYEMAHTLICSFHPLVMDKCSLKPFFVTATMTKLVEPMAAAIDGYAFFPNMPEVTQRIEEIYNNMARLGLHYIHFEKRTVEIELIKQCRFMISRNILTFPPILLSSSHSGYTSQFSEIFEKLHMITYTERLFFYQRLLSLGYIRQRRFVDRIYVCPDCMHSHMLFIEVCPKCLNSNISEEPVLHHFRCANVSPESTYLFDGQLRCPKCRHFLRHIGVDYDRPANLYLCKTCQNSFTSPHMKVVCTECRKTFTTSQLIPVDIVEYELTPMGIDAFVSNTAYLSTQEEISPGYVKISDFMSQLRSFPMLQKNTSNKECAIIGRLWMGNRNGGTMRIRMDHVLIQYVYIEFSGNYKISTNGHMVYVIQYVPLDQEETRRLRTEEKMQRVIRKIEALQIEDYNPGFDTIVGRAEAVNEEFVKNLGITPPRIERI